ncbi:MAG: hypothetical protein MUF54_09370, partial [Polyangiaceae bacterium]|nr:hypothetical protein [Polyangiaceae bacterium]
MREVLRAVVVAGLLVAAVGITVRPAHAQAFESGAATAVDKAQELKRVGNEAMERGRPADALAMYRAAYETDPNAALLYNIGRAYLAL